MADELSERVRERLKDEMRRQNLSQRSVAGLLGWSQSRVARVMTGRAEMSVDDLGALCFALSVHITEVVRDPGLEFLAEMTPSELRLLERIRQLPKPIMDSISMLLDVASKTRIQERKAKPSKKGSMPTLSNLR